MRWLGFRFKIAIFIGTLFLLVFGGNSLLQALRFRAPVVITAEEFEKQKPTAGWFHIKNCVLDGIDEVHFHPKDEADDFSKIKEVYIPVYSAKTYDKEKGGSKTINAMVLTRDTKTLDSLREANGALSGPKGADDTKALDYMVKNLGKLVQRRDVEGMVRSGLESISADEKSQLAKNDSTPAPDFVTLEEGKQPSLLAGVGLLFAGLALLAAQFFYYIVLRRR